MILLLSVSHKHAACGDGEGEEDGASEGEGNVDGEGEELGCTFCPIARTVTDRGFKIVVKEFCISSTFPLAVQVGARSSGEEPLNTQTAPTPDPAKFCNITDIS